MTSKPPLMLSVSGCRGIVGQTMTPDTVVRFACALGAHLTARRGDRPGPARIVVGRDGRAGGHMLLHGALCGLTASGCEVHDAGVAMTPTVGQYADAIGADGGLVLTASHNPQPWNGLKPMVRAPEAPPGARDACAPDAAVANAIISLYEQRAVSLVEWNGIGACLDRAEAARRSHLDRVLGFMKEIGTLEAVRGRRFHVVLDSVNGSGRRAGREFLESLGCTVSHLHDEECGVFPHTPEPLRENLTGLAEQVARRGAAVGFAQDPDADRLAVVDDTGRYIGEEYTLALSADSLLGSGAAPAGQVLCTNLSTSRMLDDAAARHGARVIRTAVGEANVVAAMKAHGAILGGEGNGGVILPCVTYIRDSLSAMSLVLTLMARKSESLSRIVDAIPSYAIVKRKVDLPDRAAASAAVETLARTFRNERVDRQDGVWVGFDSRRAWLHVRASNTEPIMRLIAEAPTEDEACSILGEAARALG